MQNKEIIIGISLIFLFFILDFISKSLLVYYVPYGSSIAIVKGFFNIVNIRNSGIAFGMFAYLSEFYRVFFLCGISFVIFVAIVVIIVKRRDRDVMYMVGLSLVGGGALGNLYDRLFKGYVVDFLDFYYKSLHYPAFNLADSFITIGMFLIVIHLLKEKTG